MRGEEVEGRKDNGVYASVTSSPHRASVETSGSSVPCGSKPALDEHCSVIAGTSEFCPPAVNRGVHDGKLRLGFRGRSALDGKAFNSALSVGSSINKTFFFPCFHSSRQLDCGGFAQNVDLLACGVQAGGDRSGGGPSLS